MAVRDIYIVDGWCMVGANNSKAVLFGSWHDNENNTYLIRLNGEDIRVTASTANRSLYTRLVLVLHLLDSALTVCLSASLCQSYQLECVFIGSNEWTCALKSSLSHYSVHRVNFITKFIGSILFSCYHSPPNRVVRFISRWICLSVCINSSSRSDLNIIVNGKLACTRRRRSLAYPFVRPVPRCSWTNSQSTKMTLLLKAKTWFNLLIIALKSGRRRRRRRRTVCSRSER